MMDFLMRYWPELLAISLVMFGMTFLFHFIESRRCRRSDCKGVAWKPTTDIDGERAWECDRCGMLLWLRKQRLR